VYMFMEEDGTQVMGHVVNAYIHLLPASQRRPAMIKRLKMEDLRQREVAIGAEIATKAGVPNVKPDYKENRSRRDKSAPPRGSRRQRGGNRKRTRSGETAAAKESKVMVAAITTMSSKFEQICDNLPTAKNYPALQEPEKVWPSKDGYIEMPADD